MLKQDDSERVVLQWALEGTVLLKSAVNWLLSTKLVVVMIYFYSMTDSNELDLFIHKTTDSTEESGFFYALK